MKGALAFEWTKLWSVRSTPWSLGAGLALTAGLSAVLGLSAKASAENGIDTITTAPQAAADSMLLVQLTLVALATLAITAEYSGGSIRATLHSVPVRGRMLLSKTAVVTAVIGGAGLLLSAVGTASAAPFMGEVGTFTVGEALSTALGTAAYAAGLAMLALGLGTMLRSSAGTITGVLLLLALPQLLGITGVEWLERAGDFLPLTAGSVLMTGHGDPYGTTAALAVMAAWSLAAITGGYAVLRARDA
ncbi:ABC transporter permease [Streptomyces sp. SBT349]|uniref:ABC transporter permease n=1 Tax=Streptomyces sp. SBT349 TaxID=1580539 RepID=UPI00066B5A0D|nr:ABC transporter permease [Streptomyces sp. SBT349]